MVVSVCPLGKAVSEDGLPASGGRSRKSVPDYAAVDTGGE